MTKTHTTLTIDEELLKKAKYAQLNISYELEKALKNRVVPEKKDLPEDNMIIVCSLCKQEIEEGFLCRERQLVLCVDCQDKFEMSKCPHDKFKEHLHIRWPGWGDQNKDFIRQVKSIQK